MSKRHLVREYQPGQETALQKLQRANAEQANARLRALTPAMKQRLSEDPTGQPAATLAKLWSVRVEHVEEYVAGVLRGEHKGEGQA